jgi:hypothetical protein
MMNRTFALLTGTVIALGSLAIVPAADARVKYFGQYGSYEVMPRYRESPTYAPDRRAPRSYNNPGRPDFQDGSRG